MNKNYEPLTLYVSNGGQSVKYTTIFLKAM